MPDQVDAFAFYLPQFYPAADNSQWWGEGYTEWNAVLSAAKGSRNLRRTVITPGELGFYDLRVPQVREQQANLAREAGLAAFCIHHYYSAGRREIPEIVDRILAGEPPDFPFFFCWANHDWTRAWWNRPEDMLRKQEYTEHVNDDHFEWLLKAFEDPRYFKIGSSPVLAIFDVDAIPDARVMFERWNLLAQLAGHSGLVVLGFSGRSERPSPESLGLTAWLQHPLAPLRSMKPFRLARMSATTPARLWRLLRYGDYVVTERMLSKLNKATGVDCIPTVAPSFNNAGRRRRRAMYLDLGPKAFGAFLKSAVARAPIVRSVDGERRLVAINAWNEWGEQNALEPSAERGRALLEQLSSTLRGQ